MDHEVIDLAERLTPRPGRGVTLHSESGLEPGTILALLNEPGSFTFQLDDLRDHPARLLPDGTKWTYRANCQPDGRHRTEIVMRRVDVGVRRHRVRSCALPGKPGQRTIRELEDCLEGVDPLLLRTAWGAVTGCPRPPMSVPPVTFKP